MITGAVGIAGTALGSWLTGRTQTSNLRLNIDAENKRAQTAEKRRIYASCIAGLDAGYTGVLTEINYRSKPSTPEKIAAIQEREASFLTALNTVAELELVASKEVANLAGKILTMLDNLDEVNPDEFTVYGTNCIEPCALILMCQTGKDRIHNLSATGKRRT